jgi:hypothetical protein
MFGGIGEGHLPVSTCESAPGGQGRNHATRSINARRCATNGTAAGFEQIEVEPTRIYTRRMTKGFLAKNEDVEKIAQMADGKFMSAFVRARRPF